MPFFTSGGLGLVISGLGLGIGVDLKNLVLFTSLVDNEHKDEMKYARRQCSKPDQLSPAVAREGGATVNAVSLLQRFLV